MARILIIEDDSDIRSLMKQIVELVGHEIVEAVDGNDGMEKLEESTIDLVISDIFMPDKEGLSVIQDIRKTNKSIPVIAVSAGGKYYLDSALDFGANKALAKPFEPEELINAVKECLE